MKRDDVETHYDYGRRLPAVNVKLHDLPFGGGYQSAADRERFAAIVADVADECGADPDAFAAWWADKAEESDEWPSGRDDWGWIGEAAGDAFEMAQTDAEEVWPGRRVTVGQEGRSGGWLVVDGLPELDEWDAVMLAKWARFRRYVLSILADFPRSVVWLVCANQYEREMAEAAEAARKAWEPGPVARYMARTEPDHMADRIAS